MLMPILWILLGALSAFALLALADWIARRWNATTDALTLGYCTTPRHGLALTSDRANMQAIVTRRFRGAQEIGPIDEHGRVAAGAVVELPITLRYQAWRANARAAGAIAPPPPPPFAIPAHPEPIDQVPFERAP